MLVDNIKVARLFSMEDVASIFNNAHRNITVNVGNNGSPLVSFDEIEEAFIHHLREHLKSSVEELFLRD